MRIQKIMPKLFPFRGIVSSDKKESNDVIQQAMTELSKIEFENNDRIYIKSMGATLPFNNGKEACDYINKNGIKIEYAKLTPDDVHACWVHHDKTIYLNEKYKKQTSFADTLAISEAILHETGHAKDNDNDNSLQEEFNCLALNVLAHKFHKKTYKDVFKGQDSFLYTEGVGLYEKLFFEFDPQKTKLKKRIKEKYGFLKTGSIKHPESDFVKKIKSETAV